MSKVEKAPLLPAEQQAPQSAPQPKSLAFIWVNFAFYMATTAYMFDRVMSGKIKNYDADREEADWFYTIAGVVFAATALFVIFSYLQCKDPHKKQCMTIMLVILFVVSISWFNLRLRLGVTRKDHAGNPLDFIRWTEWTHDTCAIAYMIGVWTDARPRHVFWAVHGSFWMCVTGFLAALTRHPYFELFGTASQLFFLHLAQHLDAMFVKADKKRLGAFSVQAARVATLFAWWWITIAWYFQKSHILTFAHGEIAIGVGEFIAKTVTMFIILASVSDETQEMKMGRIENLTEQMGEQLANADKLLEKLIPPSVLQQLQAGKGASAEEYKSVTVFFSDIANFTVLSSRNTPKDMINSLNKLWVEYDAIAAKYGMYKVETVGDAFLGVCGAPQVFANHAERAANFSLDIIEMVRTFRTVKDESIAIRIGLCSGPVTGGIIGETNPHWCIMGEPVILASKMESTAKIMHIHIAETTYKLLVDAPFNLEPAEDLTIKGKVFKTWYITSRK